MGKIEQDVFELPMQDLQDALDLLSFQCLGLFGTTGRRENLDARFMPQQDAVHDLRVDLPGADRSKVPPAVSQGHVQHEGALPVDQRQVHQRNGIRPDLGKADR